MGVHIINGEIRLLHERKVQSQVVKELVILAKNKVELFIFNPVLELLLVGLILNFNFIFLILIECVLKLSIIMSAKVLVLMERVVTLLTEVVVGTIMALELSKFDLADSTADE